MDEWEKMEAEACAFGETFEPNVCVAQGIHLHKIDTRKYIE